MRLQALNKAAHAAGYAMALCEDQLEQYQFNGDLSLRGRGSIESHVRLSGGDVRPATVSRRKASYQRDLMSSVYGLFARHAPA